MKVFEFQFNPQERKDRFFKTLSSESLFFVGELANALPQNAQFLNNLTATAKDEYEASSEHNLKKTLQKINEVLQTCVANGNVDWMGNLHAALLAFSSKGQNQIFSFAKSGTIKVLMARRGAFVDLGKTIESFKNFVSGMILPEDKIIVCTKELFDVFSSQNVLGDFAFFNEEKQFKELFRAKEKELKKTSGILFSFVIEQTAEPAKKPAPLLKIPSLKISKLKIPNLIPHFKISIPAFPKVSLEKRNLIVISLFFAVLLLGFGVFGAREDEATAATLQKVKSLESNKKFLEAWEALSPLVNSKKSLSREVSSLKQELESKLLPLYFVEDIRKPELFYQVKKEKTNLIPHDMTLSNSRLYLSNPFSPQVFEINIENKNGQVISEPKNSKAAGSNVGFTWALLNGNEIQKYYKGSYQKSFKPNIFPALVHGLRVKTSSQFKYLYLLDPSEKRVLLFTKSGELIKQYRSSTFDNLTDFAVSNNEKAIYLLNGSLIFRILL